MTGRTKASSGGGNMIQIVWVLMPAAIFFVLLLLVEWFWLYER